MDELPSDVIKDIFDYLDLNEFLCLRVLSSDWKSKIEGIDDYWKRRCLKLINLEKSDSIPTWFEWSKVIHENMFKNDLFEGEISYSNNHLTTHKDLPLHDTNVVFVRREVRSGRAYCEFKLDAKLDELLIGVTHNPEKIRNTRGWDLIKHPETWGYWDQRVGIQNGGAVSIDKVETYSTGDSIEFYVAILRDVGHERRLHIYL
eukprot:TRINITY_DN1082_c0_g2_i3.p1 TRINITY_DN1082_c0_g2~~TRINITY_DN1082_c0_g2_i3.p1  ORF type:complete len:203 (-),score=22.48 TRINITY_DN1082_c0_g2_i3:214-822(-)